jgi:hypothetical protein
MAIFIKVSLTSGNQNPPKSLFNLFWISFFGGNFANYYRNEKDCQGY